MRQFSVWITHRHAPHEGLRLDQVLGTVADDLDHRGVDAELTQAL